MSKGAWGISSITKDKREIQISAMISKDCYDKLIIFENEHREKKRKDIIEDALRYYFKKRQK